MTKIPEERRLYPRIKSNLKVDILEDINGNSIDLSEDGLSLNSQETISSPTVSLQINFPDLTSPFKINARLVWKRDLESGGSLYGMEFVGLNEIQKSELRKELIKSQISGLLHDIKDSSIKKDISYFFLKDMLEYINKILKLISLISKEKEYSLELEKEFERLNNEILLKGYSLEEVIEHKITIEKIKEHFRFLVGTWAYKSPIVKRAFEKPRGYAGDYLMLETIYNNKPFSSGIGLYFDKYFLNNPYAVAVRYRKDKLREIIKKEIEQSNSEIIKIFNIACGSCREIRELPMDLFKGKTVIFTCLDWDEEALEFSKQAVKNLPGNVKFNFLKEDILKIIKDVSSLDKFPKQDIVYSIGLIDYLPDRILKMFMQFFYRILKEQGMLFLTHKNKEKTFSPLPPGWFCDWKFVSREKEEVIGLFYNCGIENFFLSTEVDEFNDIFYFTIVKHSKVYV